VLQASASELRIQKQRKDGDPACILCRYISEGFFEVAMAQNEIPSFFWARWESTSRPLSIERLNTVPTHTKDLCDLHLASNYLQIVSSFWSITMRHGGPNNNEFSQTLILVDYVPFSVAATELSSRKCLGRGYSRFSVYTSHKSLYQALQPSWQ